MEAKSKSRGTPGTNKDEDREEEQMIMGKYEPIYGWETNLMQVTDSTNAT